MSDQENEDWAFPAAMQPDSDELSFDLDAVLDAVVTVRAEIPEDAFTADTLGTDRIGNGVLIRDSGIVLTIGYLITEATSIWLTTNDGVVVQAYPLAYDQVTGFGLVRALNPLGISPLSLGDSDNLTPGDELIIVGQGGRSHASKTRLIAIREFAGYWEYLLDEALFTSPAHPRWGGAALLNHAGELVGIGSLLVQEAMEGDSTQGNMIVPIDLLKPILDELITSGAVSTPPRPWLGLFAHESESQLEVAGLVGGGPSATANVRRGDVLLKVGDQRVETLAGFLRAVWKLGPAGTKIPLMISREGDVLRVEVESANRNLLLKGPSLH
ncbi:MAG: S1C family serine protease [Burkholderiaceae bacterium]